MRRTVARSAERAGVGLHSGPATRVRVRPAPPGSGLALVRTDVPAPRRIVVGLASVAATERRTALRSGEQRVDTVEHLLAAVMAAEYDDLLVEVDGPEVPILDGSFAPFVDLLAEAGVLEQAGRPRVATLHSPVTMELHGGWYVAEPAAEGRLAVALEYQELVIGHQAASLELRPGVFAREVAGARTYGFLAEVAPLRERGLLAGASEDCAIVLDDARVLNTTLRWPDEFARHKLGDLLGDLALLGARLRLAVSAVRPSHRGNIAFARVLAGAVSYGEE
ncbi:MAG: UDP-3-O-[3-hydroxymyristoyl] N-acetylglucosamine deacetylase [Gemmatimonadetes bacterium]|nr:UDP-3-O-[3-hydroxymyristoyl] N-acetylglucosamine deacetylase [Gemmatimonadota bacterium]